MARRYSDIKRAAQLQAGLTAYIAYLQNSANRPSGVGTKGPRGLNKTVFVAPFTTQVAATELCAAKVRQDAFNMISPSILGGSTKANVAETLGANTLVSFPRFRASRVVLFHNAARVAAAEPSKVTGIRYLKYEGDHFSCPMGATADTDDEMEAFLDVKAALLVALAASEVKRVSLNREFVGVESV